MKCLVLAEYDGQLLCSSTASAITAAKQICGEIHVLVAGHDCLPIAEQAAGLIGVTNVLVLDAAAYAKALAEPLSSALALIAKSYSHVIAAAGMHGRNVLARTAALLDVGMFSDVLAVLDATTFKRPLYAGNVIATVQALDSIVLLTVRPSSFEATSPSAIRASIMTLPQDEESDVTGTVWISEDRVHSERPDLSTAKVVISGGRGMKSGEHFAALERIADKLGGAVGASRAAVDAGFIGNELQVGQTGKVVAPTLYIAVGISGAIQHLAGMSGSKVIVAINHDPEAPIAQVADFILQQDLFVALPQLEALL